MSVFTEAWPRRRNVDKKAVLSQGNCAMQHILPTHNDSSIVIIVQIYIHCMKADLNVKI